MTIGKVADASEVSPSKMKKVSVEGEEILLANVGGTCYAIGNKCTHMGGDLSKGTLSGNLVKCPRHGAVFDVTTGRTVLGPKMLGITVEARDEPTFGVRVEKGSVYLDL